MKLGLIGKNISYSLSPKLHKIISELNGINLTYEIIDINSDKLEELILKGSKLGYSGFNITVPYKEEVIKYLDNLKGVASQAKAVNTISYNDGISGYNTDYEGFIKWTVKHEFTSNKVYILGSGGASKIVYKVFYEKGFEVIVVSRDKGSGKYPKMISYEEFKEIKTIDTLVNTTPIGSLSNDGCPILNSTQKINLVLDLIYNPRKTILMSKALRSDNGLEMLIYQAIASLEIWSGKSLKKDDKTIQYIKEVLMYE